jgi:hypothetical protein
VASQVSAGKFGQGKIAALAGERRRLPGSAQPLARVDEQMLATRNRTQNGQATVGGGKQQVNRGLPFRRDAFLLEPFAKPTATQRAFLNKRPLDEGDAAIRFITRESLPRQPAPNGDPLSWR